MLVYEVLQAGIAHSLAQLIRDLRTGPAEQLLEVQNGIMWVYHAALYAVSPSLPTASMAMARFDGNNRRSSHHALLRMKDMR